jgi:tRNA A37 N6-isopentenylltransferase MiaA
VHRLTGVPISQWQRARAGAGEEFRWLRYAVLPTSRIDWRRHLAARFHAMLGPDCSMKYVRCMRAVI